MPKAKDKGKEAKGNEAISRYYEIKGEKVVRTRKFCPRCGEGVFLAEHSDRLSCGKCGYTEFKRK